MGVEPGAHGQSSGILGSAPDYSPQRQRTHLVVVLPADVEGGGGVPGLFGDLAGLLKLPLHACDAHLERPDRASFNPLAS